MATLGLIVAKERRLYNAPAMEVNTHIIINDAECFN